MDMGRSRRRTWRGAAPGVLLTAGTLTAAAPGAQADGARTETPVASTSPVTGVLGSAVRVKVPLPESAGARPAVCDRLSYLRHRAADGPGGTDEHGGLGEPVRGTVGGGGQPPVGEGGLEAVGRVRADRLTAVDQRGDTVEPQVRLLAVGDGAAAVVVGEVGRGADGPRMRAEQPEPPHGLVQEGGRVHQHRQHTAHHGRGDAEHQPHVVVERQPARTGHRMGVGAVGGQRLPGVGDGACVKSVIAGE